MATAFVTDTRFDAHTLDGHPEYAERLQAIRQRLQADGLIERFVNCTAQPVDDESLLAVHTPDYVNQLAKLVGRAVMFGLDTYAMPESYEIARLAAGSVLRVVDAVLQGCADNGLAAIRPPGHHATPSQAMGFCLLNNIAIAARYAQRVHDVERVLIVDYDVHHGNGTQDVFYADPSVLYISTHQSPLYPGTGMEMEIGRGDGRGTTLNIPLPPGVGDRGYTQVFESVIGPAARRFAPGLILVSAGFDAHWADPLANMQLTLLGYDRLARFMLSLASEVCESRIVFVLEGGYDLTVLSTAVANVAHALLGDEDIEDPLGAGRKHEPEIGRLIERLKQLHKLT